MTGLERPTLSVERHRAARFAEAAMRSAAAPTDITREGAIYQRSLANGMEICVYPRVFNAILTYGKVEVSFYVTHWCYETPGQAVLAAEEWDGLYKAGIDEPEGWFRHADSGRRRPGGDPAQEYVNY